MGLIGRSGLVVFAGEAARFIDHDEDIRPLSPEKLWAALMHFGSMFNKPL